MEDTAVAVWLSHLRDELLLLDREIFSSSTLYETRRQKLRDELMPLHFRLSRDGFGQHCIVPLLFPDKGI